jgi:hypothetical protein
MVIESSSTLTGWALADVSFFVLTFAVPHAAGRTSADGTQALWACLVHPWAALHTFGLPNFVFPADCADFF